MENPEHLHTKIVNQRGVKRVDSAGVIRESQQRLFKN